MIFQKRPWGGKKKKKKMYPVNFKGKNNEIKNY